MPNFEKSELIIKNFPGYISWFDKNLQYLGINIGLEKLLGITNQQIQGKKLGEVLQDDNSILIQEFCKFVSSTSTISSNDYEIIVNGKKLYVHTHFLKLDNGNVNLIASEDYSEKMFLNEILLKQKEMTNTNVRLTALGEMVSSIAHEINNPMTIISGLVSRLEKKNNGDDQFIFDKINLQVRRITNIISSLRLISENVSEQIYNLVSLEVILKHSIQNVQEKLFENKIKLEVDLKEDVFLECVENQLEQVFLGILDNAIDAVKFHPDRWIKINVENASEMIRIRFIDSGNGIPENIKDRIMEPFFTTKDVGKGIGLGLSISRRIIEVHEGIFYLNSESQNTEFVIELKKNISFDVAIRSHTEWRARLEKYMLNPTGEYDHETICKDNVCRLGKWLYSEEYRLGNIQEWKLLRETHKQFHLLAGNIVKTNCKIGSDLHKEFCLVSNETVGMILNLRDKIKGIS